MARTNLRAVFMSSVDSPVAAQQVFTNRSDEVAAFERSLAAHAEALAGSGLSPVADRAQGRRNVLAFYGLGGIGKTTLSQELERRLLEGELTEGPDRAIAVRIDLAEPGATDIETLLLRLRAGLGQLGRRWRAFDLALACYWARAHQGEALQEFFDASPLVRRVAKSIGLEEQINENIGVVVDVELGGLTGLAQKAAIGAYRKVRERVREGRVLANCDLFSELVEADADYETLSFFPYLLAWDLEQISAGNTPTVCVFLDTFEVLTNQADQTVERFVQRLMYLMPNVLFVVTGRNRIDWADSAARGELDFSGPERWPNLHFSNSTEGPRQHLVGYLSDSDADSYLCEALVRDGQPAMPAAVRERIIAGGQGLPLYLDLSVSHFVERLSRGGEPDPDDFGGSFTAVATRAIRDLPPHERDLVRTAALVDRFDADLLRAGQPGATDGTVARFLRRPFLLHDDSYQLPYALHQALRAAIEEADEAALDGWSARDRADVAQRLLLGLGTSLAPDGDRSITAMAVQAGLSLAGRYDVYDDWLTRACQRLFEAGQWSSMNSWLPPTSGDQQELNVLRAAIHGVVLRRSGDAPAAVELLERTEVEYDDCGPASELLRLHLAHALRNVGDYTRAAALLESLTGGEFNAVARYWLCDYDYLNGRFTRALTELERTRTTGSAEEGERLRLIGHILRVNARFDLAASTYRRAIDLARSEGLAAAEAKALTNLAQTACWSGETATVTTVAEEARALLDLIPNPVEGVKLRSAEAIAAAIEGDVDTASTAIDETRSLADEISYRGGHNLADVASILLDVLSGQRERARASLGALNDRTQASGGNVYWVPIAITWLDGADAAAERSDAIGWLGGADETLGRWEQVVNR